MNINNFNQLYIHRKVTPQEDPLTRWCVPWEISITFRSIVSKVTFLCIHIYIKIKWTYFSIERLIMKICSEYRSMQMKLQSKEYMYTWIVVWLFIFIFISRTLLSISFNWWWEFRAVWNHKFIYYFDFHGLFWRMLMNEEQIFHHIFLP